MAVPNTIQYAKGSWKGKSKLNQSWLPPEKRVSESDSNLHIDTDERGNFATITYTWHQDDKRQEGTMLVCSGKTSGVQIGWVDSWHENSAVMHLHGEERPNGTVFTKGIYKAGGEEWGWTIAFSLGDDGLTLKMENVTPKGEAEWAVEAHYQRS